MRRLLALTQPILALGLWVCVANQLHAGWRPILAICRPITTFAAAPSPLPAVAPRSYGTSETMVMTRMTDPFAITTNVDCADIKLVDAELMKLIQAIGMSVVDLGDPAAFSAILPDEPGSRDGDVVEVKLSWSIDQPGKRIDVYIVYERIIFVRAASNELRRVEPTAAGYNRFSKLKAAVSKLQVPIALVSTSPTPTQLSTSATSNP